MASVYWLHGELVKASAQLSATALSYSTLKNCRKDTVNLHLVPDYGHMVPDYVHMWFVHSVNPT